MRKYLTYMGYNVGRNIGDRFDAKMVPRYLSPEMKKALRILRKRGSVSIDVCLHAPYNRGFKLQDIICEIVDQNKTVQFFSTNSCYVHVLVDNSPVVNMLWETA